MTEDEFREQMLGKFAEMATALETISAQLCPVCGPRIAEEKHPETQPQAANGKASVKG